MKLLSLLKRLIRSLDREPCEYCLIGGHAASLYRSQERFTRDIDFALVAKPKKGSEAAARRALDRLGLDPVAAFIPRSPAEPKRRSVCLITSAPKRGELTGEIDIILPELPWVEAAVSRAQFNRIDLGFAQIPVITPEDLIVAKCYALRNSPDRFQDLDDLKEIFESAIEFDRSYLQSALDRHELTVPKPVLKHYRKMMRRKGGK